MIAAVFISDLHLHPDDASIQKRFTHFIEWAKGRVKVVYILGDFFNAWPGDDGINQWSRAIALQLAGLRQQGVEVYYMHGNRDFLLGRSFADLAGWTVLSEPHLIQLGKETVLLAHGDSFCTNDKGHQRFRRLTRNSLFRQLFLALPLRFRLGLVNRVRQISMNNTTKSASTMDVVPESAIKAMIKHKVKTLIHGHTHKPGLTAYETRQGTLKRYVLSDWDDKPQIMCYDETKGISFIQI